MLSTDDYRPPAQGLQIRGTWITGNLNLEGEAVPVPLYLYNCTLDEDVNLHNCTLPALYPPGTQLSALHAQRLRCGGDLHLRDGFEATGLVDLAGAKITGQLACHGGKFLAKDVALHCDTITVGATAHLSDGFEAKRKVGLAGAIGCLGQDQTRARRCTPG